MSQLLMLGSVISSNGSSTPFTPTLTAHLLSVSSVTKHGPREPGRCFCPCCALSILLLVERMHQEGGVSPALHVAQPRM